MSSSGSGTVINYGSGSDFLTSYGSGYGSGSTSQKVTVPVPVPQHCRQQHHISGRHVVLLLRPFVRQHPSPEDLAHPLVPELLLRFLDELQVLRELRRLAESYLQYFHRRAAKQQMQWRDWSARLRVSSAVGYGPAVDYLRRPRPLSCPSPPSCTSSQLALPPGTS
jgi:hypothetical protein